MGNKLNFAILDFEKVGINQESFFKLPKFGSRYGSKVSVSHKRPWIYMQRVNRFTVADLLMIKIAYIAFGFEDFKRISF